MHQIDQLKTCNDKSDICNQKITLLTGFAWTARGLRCLSYSSYVSVSKAYSTPLSNLFRCSLDIPSSLLLSLASICVDFDGNIHNLNSS